MGVSDSPPVSILIGLTSFFILSTVEADDDSIFAGLPVQSGLGLVALVGTASTYRTAKHIRSTFGIGMKSGVVFTLAFVDATISLVGNLLMLGFALAMAAGLKARTYDRGL